MSIEINREGLEKLDYSRTETVRPVNQGAEQWMGVVVPVLDHGFIYLQDYMGTDESIDEAARVSYGSGTRQVSDTQNLLRYLMRHHHTSPFEMNEFKFHAKMPIFVARQWVRHRTASLNEYSGRYSILDKEFYIPEPESMATQSKSNRQGREEVMDYKQTAHIRNLLITDATTAYDHYEYMLNDDGTGKPKDEERGMLARELARMNLSLNYYTQWYWKVDLHNMLHFLQLRMDPHAQEEIRAYANIMGQIVKESLPITWKAFEDYRLNAMSLSGPEQTVLINLLASRGIVYETNQIRQFAENSGLANNREQKELIEKMGKLGLISDE